MDFAATAPLDELFLLAELKTRILRGRATYGDWTVANERRDLDREQLEEHLDGMVYGATADAPQSLVDARDIAAVAARVLLDPAPHAGKAYTLTSDEALTDSQRVDILSKVLGHPVGFTAVPLAAAEDSLRGMGLPAELVDWMGSLNAIISASYASGTTGDVEALLGRQPIRFAQFARDYAASWK